MVAKGQDEGMAADAKIRLAGLDAGQGGDRATAYRTRQAFHPNDIECYQQANRRIVPPVCVQISRITREHCLRSRPQVHITFLEELDQGPRSQYTDVNISAPPDRWTIGSDSEDYSEAAETVLLAGPGLGRIITVPRICLQ
jgi:hypothetical protein